MTERPAKARCVGMSSERLTWAALWRTRRGQLGILLGGTTKDSTSVGTRPLSVRYARNDGACIITVVRSDLGRKAIFVDELLGWSHNGTQISLFGGGGVGKDDEGGGVVDPFDLVATLVIFVGSKDLLEIAGLELRREAGEFEDARDQRREEWQCRCDRHCGQRL